LGIHTRPADDAHLKLSTVSNDDLCTSRPTFATISFNGFDDVETFNNLSKDDMLAVEPSSLGGA
jgi:hypothetical protein